MQHASLIINQVESAAYYSYNLTSGCSYEIIVLTGDKRPIMDTQQLERKADIGRFNLFKLR